MSDITVHLLAGMKAKIKVPVDHLRGRRYFPRTEKMTINGEAKDLTRGFAVADDNVGSIVASTESEVSVVYTHKKSLKNLIYFFSAYDEMAVITVSSVPIHDHSSIVQGGPAYGTYFSDDESRSGG